MELTTDHLDPIGTIYKTAHISSLTETRPLSVVIVTYKVTAHKEIALGSHPNAPGRMAQAVDCLDIEYRQIIDDKLLNAIYSGEGIIESLQQWLNNHDMDCRIEGL